MRRRIVLLLASMIVFTALPVSDAYAEEMVISNSISEECEPEKECEVMSDAESGAECKESCEAECTDGEGCEAGSDDSKPASNSDDSEVFITEDAKSDGQFSPELVREFYTIDGRTIRTEPNGKPMVLIFFGTECMYCQNAMEGFANANIDSRSADYIAIEIDRHTRDEVAEFSSRYSLGGMTFCYDYSWRANNLSWNYIWKFYDTNSYTKPLVVVVGEDGELVACYTGQEWDIAGKTERSLASIKVDSFVKRLYRTVLERDPDQNGLSYWKESLINGSRTGADVVAEFYSSDEMKGRGLSNSKFMDLAYKGIMGRSPDPNGKGYWIEGLEAGATYDYVACGFIGSQEFSDLCSSYGINKGSRTPADARDRNIGVTKFVSRLYKKCLNRGYDANGLTYWCQRILDDPNRDNLINVAYDGFYHSEELKNQNLSNDEYIRRCYRTFLNREAEGEGFNYWKRLLDSGEKTRDDLVRDFAYSEEFSGIMSSYGL